jgi:HlyD family secretion protein
MTSAHSDIARLNRRALIALVVFFGLGGCWIALAPLSAAVVARGVVTVESSVKRIQHPAGGLVTEILVRDGDRVAAGATLVRLDAGQARANLTVINTQLDALQVREARLQAERDDLQAFAVPDHLDKRRNEPALSQAIAGEIALFETRRAAREGQTAQLRERIDQLRNEERSVRDLATLRARETQLVSKELQDIKGLYKSGWATRTRLTALEREHARLTGERLQFATDAVRTQGRNSEIEIEILRRHSEFKTEVVDQLRDVQVRLAELRERRLTASEVMSRIEIRAPVAGVVHGSVLHTVGGVIAAGDTVMRIVPDGDPLVIEARVAPGDVDRVTVGAETKVRLLAGHTRTATDLSGNVLHVGADLVRDDQSGDSYFSVRISLDRHAAERSAGVPLQSGMPAEAFIHAGDRTALAYLLQPISDQLSLAMRER